MHTYSFYHIIEKHPINTKSLPYFLLRIFRWRSKNCCGKIRKQLALSRTQHPHTTAENAQKACFPLLLGLSSFKRYTCRCRQFEYLTFFQNGNGFAMLACPAFRAIYINVSSCIFQAKICSLPYGFYCFHPHIKVSIITQKLRNL